MEIVSNTRLNGEIHCPSFGGCGSVFRYTKTDIEVLGISQFAKGFKDDIFEFEDYYGVRCPVCGIGIVLYSE